MAGIQRCSGSGRIPVNWEQEQGAGPHTVQVFCLEAGRDPLGDQHQFLAQFRALFLEALVAALLGLRDLESYLCGRGSAVPPPRTDARLNSAKLAVAG